MPKKIEEYPTYKYSKENKKSKWNKNNSQNRNRRKLKEKKDIEYGISEYHMRFFWGGSIFIKTINTQIYFNNFI